MPLRALVLLLLSCDGACSYVGGAYSADRAANAAKGAAVLPVLLVLFSLTVVFDGIEAPSSSKYALYGACCE